MTASRRVLLSAAVALLCALLLSVAPAALGQHAGCGTIVGTPNPAGFTVQSQPMAASTLFAVGTFTAPLTMEANYNSFGFVFALPEQEIVNVPNQFKFALYDADSQTLVTESAFITVTSAAAQSISGSASTGLLMGQHTYVLAVYSTMPYTYYANTDASQPAVIVTGYSVETAGGFPNLLTSHAYSTSAINALVPVALEGCAGSSFVGHGHPVLNGFNGQRFIVQGLPGRAYNVLSLPSLHLNTRFVPLVAGQAMNSTEQSSVRHRQSKLITAILGAGAANILPSTPSWSHDGLYMGDTGVQLSGHRLLVRPGAYASGFDAVELDGVEMAVSADAFTLEDGATIFRTSSSVIEVATAEVSFTLVNSDHFLNIHSALLHILQSEVEHVDGLLVQTAPELFEEGNTDDFKQRIESDFLLAAADDDLWSTTFEHSQYVTATSELDTKQT